MAMHYNEDNIRKPCQEMEVGDKVTTKSRVISKTEIELAALLGGDYLGQFLSEKGAKENGWERQLVPGPHVIFVGYGLLIQNGFLKEVKAYMGTSDMKFERPVYCEDSIRMEAVVTSKKKSKQGWICEYDWTIRNQDNVTVAHGHNT